MISNSLACSTKKVYKRSWLEFKDVCQQFSLQYFPANNRTILFYIGHCADSGLSYRSIMTRISSVSFVHKFRGVTDATHDFIVKKCLLGCKNSNVSMDIRKPISLVMLHNMCDKLPDLFPTLYHVTLFKAMFMLAFYAFLRVSEFTMTSKNNVHILVRSNVKLLRSTTGQPSTLEVTFNSFKHSKGRPFTLSINRASNPNYCPVMAISQYLCLRSGVPGALFIFPDNVPVSSRYFNSMLKCIVCNTVGSCAGYSSHSFRIGSATHCFHVRRMSKERISKMARWNSNAIDSYIRVHSFTT